MYTFDFKALVLVILALDVISIVQAAVFVLKPTSGSVCHGGQDCTIQWIDDGESPGLRQIGVVTIGLYTGDMQLVQNIPATNVADTQSVTFKPIPEAGPNSKSYYIALISISAKVNGSAYIGYSPFFELDGMSGSFRSPLESATLPIPIPSSLTNSAAEESTALSTITIGTLSTDRPSLSISLPSASATTPIVISSPSGFSTSVAPRPTSTSGSTNSQTTTAGVVSPSPSSNAAGRTRTGDIPLLGVLSLSLAFFTIV